MAEQRTRVSWEDVVQSAARRVRRDGIARLDLDDVREDLGAGPGAVSYWFSDETDLLISIMGVRQRWFLDQADTRLAAVKTHREKLSALLELHIADHDMAYWIELWKLARRDERARRARQELTARYRELFARVIRAGQRAGEFEPVPPDRAALILDALTIGLSVDATVSGDERVETMRDALVSACECLLGTDMRGVDGAS